jgi:hypothetical protein
MTVSVDRHFLTVNATTGRGVIARHGHETGATSTPDAA